MEGSRPYRMYAWINRHALTVTVSLILAVIAIGATGVVVADTEEPSFDPKSEIATIDERANSTLGSESSVEYSMFLVEAVDGGDVLTANALREWKAASDRVRSSSDNDAHLVGRFDPDTGAVIPGVHSIVDVVDASLSRGLSAATDDEIKAAVASVLAADSPFADMRHSLSEVAEYTSGAWRSPAFTTQIVYDTATFEDNAAGSIEASVPGLGASVSGEVLASYHGLSAFTRSMLVSLPFAVVLTLILASLLLRSFRYALVSVIPIAFVVVGVYAFMAIAGYSVNVVTATIAAIAVGVGIDSRRTSRQGIAKNWRTTPIASTPFNGPAKEPAAHWCSRH